MSTEGVTLTDLEGRATITVDEAARLIGIGRSAGYQAVASGDLPSIKIGRRIVIPVAPLLRMLEVEDAGEWGDPLDGD